MFSTLECMYGSASRALERCSSCNVVETLCLGYVLSLSLPYNTENASCPEEATEAYEGVWAP